GTGCIVGRSLRWSGATVAHLSCKPVVAGSIPVSSSMTSPSPGRASLLMLPGEGLLPSAAQKVSYVARFSMYPLPVRVFQQVMPSKRLVQAMSPEVALSSSSSVSAESLRKEEPQARSASPSPTRIEKGPASQPSTPLPLKSCSSTEQEAVSSSSRQVMFPVGERSSDISRASSGAGETGSSVSSSVGSSAGCSEGDSSADVVEESRWYSSSSSASHARPTSATTTTSSRASSRQPPQAYQVRRRERAPSSWSGSTPPAAAPSSYTGAAGAGGAAEAGEDAVGGVAPSGTTREFSESRTPGAADCAGASCAASDDAA